MQVLKKCRGGIYDTRNTGLDESSPCKINNAGVGFIRPAIPGLMNQAPTGPRPGKWAMALGFLEFANGDILCKG